MKHRIRTKPPVSRRPSQPTTASLRDTMTILGAVFEELDGTLRHVLPLALYRKVRNTLTARLTTRLQKFQQ